MALMPIKCSKCGKTIHAIGQELIESERIFGMIKDGFYPPCDCEIKSLVDDMIKELRRQQEKKVK